MIPNTNAQRRLRSAWAFAQSDQSSMCAQWVATNPRFLHADSKDSDQTKQMPRLIWVFPERTIILLVLSCHKSNYHLHCLQTPVIGILRIIKKLNKFFFSKMHFRTITSSPWGHQSRSTSLQETNHEKHDFHKTSKSALLFVWIDAN